MTGIPALKVLQYPKLFKEAALILTFVSLKLLPPIFLIFFKCPAVFYYNLIHQQQVLEFDEIQDPRSSLYLGTHQFEGGDFFPHSSSFTSRHQYQNPFLREKCKRTDILILSFTKILFSLLIYTVFSTGFFTTLRRWGGGALSTFWVMKRSIIVG